MALMPQLVAAQTAEEIAFAKAFLAPLQERSFATGREFCGYFGYDADGEMVAVKPRRGKSASCTTRWPHSRIDVIASYHTHGSWDKQSDGEIPSVQDVETDMADGIDGYVSTPGGRLWFIDGTFGVARQICGRDCLPTDPQFRPEPLGAIPEAITLRALRRREGG